MRIKMSKAGIMYTCVTGIFLIILIKGIRDGKLFGIDNYVFMIYVVVTRIIYLFLHELSHVLALKSRKLKIREFKIYGLRYDGVSHTWGFSIKEFDFSGYVVPWLTYDIDTDVSFLKFKSAYIFSLLAGPLFPFVVCSIVGLMGVLFSLPVEVFILTFLINAVLMLFSSLVGNKRGMGDIQAVFFVSIDTNFALQLIENLHLVKDCVSEKERNYLSRKTRDCSISKS